MKGCFKIGIGCLDIEKYAGVTISRPKQWWENTYVKTKGF